MISHSRPLFLFISLLALLSLACRLGEISTAVSTADFPTLPSPVAESEGETPAATLPSQEPVVINTAVASATTAVMTAKVDLNIRRGPSTQFAIVTAFRAGEGAPILGRSPDSNWWKIVCPGGYSGECWSSAREQYSSAVNAHNVPVAAVPPYPTATQTATATATTTATATATATFTATPTNTASPTPTGSPTMTATPEPTAYP